MLTNIFHSTKCRQLSEICICRKPTLSIHKPQTSQQVHLQMRIYTKHQNFYPKVNFKISKNKYFYKAFNCNQYAQAYQMSCLHCKSTITTNTLEAIMLTMYKKTVQEQRKTNKTPHPNVIYVAGLYLNSISTARDKYRSLNLHLGRRSNCNLEMQP